ncbi:MAG: class I tRNA ligase family protein, partial [Oscillospiraceae bacterium]|nr:class I tRNA ligase family protein [Oscillospiraceae bacterium]
MGDAERPAFPKRAVVTAGMPYGNKELHFAHIGGCMAHADVYVRFLRDRIGAENVIFVSGTDCYGSPILETYRQKRESGEYAGTMAEFVRDNHESHLRDIAAYSISFDLFASSAFGRAGEIHAETSAEFIVRLHENGCLLRMSSPQFYDPDLGVFLNGRQVVGQCPIQGCASEKGYADECSLGHQYMPTELLEPRSALTGKVPIMKDADNWYLDSERFRGLLEEWAGSMADRPWARNHTVQTVREFLKPPVIYVKREYMDKVSGLSGKGFPEHAVEDDPAKPSAQLIFKSLADREKAHGILSGEGINTRTGKTL